MKISFELILPERIDRKELGTAVMDALADICMEYGIPLPKKITMEDD